MSAAEAVLRVLEELRQRSLTRRLGQVECPGSWVDPEMHGAWMALGFEACPGCKAAL